MTMNESRAHDLAMLFLEKTIEPYTDEEVDFFGQYKEAYDNFLEELDSAYPFGKNE